MAEVQSISLYRYSGSKALIQPYAESSDSALFRHVTSPHLQQATKTLRDGGCRLKFRSPAVWMDYQTGSVMSRQILFDLVQAMQRQNMQLLCCADLNIVGPSAGTLFFQRNPEARQTELACLQLGHVDKVRIVQLSDAETEGLGHVLSTNWRYGVQTNNKYGIRGYKLQGRPWLTAETSNSHNIEARKLVIQMLRYMESNGWCRVVPFDCSVTDYDADSLLFFRESSWARRNVHSEFCAVSLERAHKIRLIGASDETTLSVFENAVRQHWRSGIRETNRFQDSRQIKCVGRPWCPNTTEENIASAQLMCGVLQQLWSLGWRWHCAIDMSVSVADKSTFFLSRNNQSALVDGGQIGCLQPKGRGKVNLVSFPPSILKRSIAGIRKARWCVPLSGIEEHNADCATIHFQCADLHRCCKTAQHSRTAKIYTDLLKIVGGADEGIALLGSADISGNYHSGGEHSSPHSLDTDAFFFLFSEAHVRERSKEGSALWASDLF